MTILRLDRLCARRLSFESLVLQKLMDLFSGHGRQIDLLHDASAIILQRQLRATSKDEGDLQIFIRICMTRLYPTKYDRWAPYKTPRQVTEELTIFRNRRTSGSLFKRHAPQEMISPVNPATAAMKDNANISPYMFVWPFLSILRSWWNKYRLYHSVDSTGVLWSHQCDMTKNYIINIDDFIACHRLVGRWWSWVAAVSYLYILPKDTMTTASAIEVSSQVSMPRRRWQLAKQQRQPSTTFSRSRALVKW